MTSDQGCSGIIIPQGLNDSRTGRIDQLEDRDGLDDEDDVRSIVCIIVRSVVLMGFAVSLETSAMEVLVIMVMVVVMDVGVGVGVGVGVVVC